ncbi:MAG: STAS domain-containing protein [Deltaproteobacteria bacterium]|nr:STAS domain-containing protein [Candidatus Anaeroferrophillacea bacterium]
MPSNRLAPIRTLLSRDRETVAEEWASDVLRAWERNYPNMISQDETRHQMGRLLAEIATLFADHDGDTPPKIPADSPLPGLAGEISASRAKLGFRPTDTAHFVIALKNVLTRHLVRMVEGSQLDLVVCLAAVDDVLDRLALMTFDAYVEARERVIAQQSLSLVELSSPVVRLWDQVILLPLVGIIDTVRARQFTERLLEAISRYEALVTIIDVTGVPVFDTGVAKHIMKAIEAAQLLGTRIVMTGLSPEGAQTLTKLNVGFGEVTSRASLRAGVAEALRMIGRRIVAIGG